MKHARLVRTFALALALLIGLAGCAAGPRMDAPSQDGQLVLVEPQSSSRAEDHRAEWPAAGDEDALTRPETLEPETMSVAGASASIFTPSTNRVNISGEIRAVWITYLEMQTLLTGKSGAQFTTNIQSVFDNVKEYGLNTVIVQVRPYGDALYRSDYYPWSYIATGTEGKDPGFDPLQIMVEQAHARGLRIEAWVNPYRVRSAGNDNALSASNQARQWLEAGDGAAIRYNGVISYNPASKKARELIVNGAVEIVRGYAVDGIHIDDYFYPSTDEAFDSASYAAYKSVGGTLPLAEWRRANVETLIKAMYDGIKAEDSTLTFGISPQSNIDTNYNTQYLDVAKIAATPGYCDYICPQIYFGFQNGTQPYQQTLERWSALVDSSVVDLYIGVAVYKVGGVDTWAGEGKNEWVGGSNLLRRMVEAARGQTGYGGFVLYRYDSLFNPAGAVAAAVGRESDNLRAILA